MATLVTGGAGYIGSVTVELLRQRGEDVVILDDLFRGHREALDPEVPFYDARVQDSALVARLVREHKIEACIHFAALLEVGESVKDPGAYFENNTAAGMSFLRALIDNGVRRVFSRPRPLFTASRGKRPSPRTIRSGPRARMAGPSS